jgi:hypothetical protein
MRAGWGRARSPLPYKEQHDIPLDADLTRAFAAEIERNRKIASQPGVVPAAVGPDPESWKFRRILVSERERAGETTRGLRRLIMLNRC